jgi:hypothetical protein
VTLHGCYCWSPDGQMLTSVWTDDRGRCHAAAMLLPFHVATIPPAM